MMSSNPESPSFNKKFYSNSSSNNRESNHFLDNRYWQQPPPSIDLDSLEAPNSKGIESHGENSDNNGLLGDGSAGGNPEYPEFNQRSERPKRSLKADVEALGVNGTVRRFEKEKLPSIPLSLPVARPALVKQSQPVVSVIRNVIQAVKKTENPIKVLKRSISKNFIKDGLANETMEEMDVKPETLDREIEQETIQDLPAPKGLEMQTRYLPTPKGIEMAQQFPSRNQTNVYQVINNYHVPDRLVQPSRPISPPSTVAHQKVAAKNQRPSQASVQQSTSNRKETQSQSTSNRKETQSSTTLHSSDETASPASLEEDSSKTEKHWFKVMQLFRALSMATHTWVTIWPGLNDERVLVLNAKNLLISILFFSTLDVALAAIKCWPKNLWCCWQVRKWDPVKYFGNVWSILADHNLLLDIVPMFANITLRIYSYRLSELVQNPDALNSISNNGFNLNNWSDPVYSNFVQLILWGISIAATLLFHTFLRIRFFTVKYHAPSLGLVIGVKSLLLLFDMCASSLFLYSFLVSLGIEIFGSSPDIPLMIGIMVASPVISTVCNTLVNIPLMYTFGQLEKGTSSQECLKKAMEKVFSPFSLILSIFDAFYIVVMAYLLNKLRLISITPQLDTLVNLVAWNPKQTVIWIISFNYALNYLIGMAFTLVYWSLKIIWKIFWN